MKPLPKNVTRMEKGENFCFSCHPSVPCFTDCCRQLELALTPYDVLRLKKACGLRSDAFLDRYVIIEQEDNETFPRLYLTMVDDGRASCVFVSETGCTLYADRPGACRAYPMGRAVIRQPDDSMEEFFVLLREKHCQGFQEQHQQNADTYSEEQGLAEYNRFNDAAATILQHEQIRRGRRLSSEQIDSFLLALYNLDLFREQLLSGHLAATTPLDANTRQQFQENDEELLLYAVKWLRHRLFND